MGRPLDQQPVRARQPALGEVGQRPHARQPGLDDRVGDLAHRACGQAVRAVELADLRSGLGGQRQPPGPRRRIGGELHRALVGGDRVPAAGHRRGRGALQLGRHLLVRSGRRRRQMPRPPVGVARTAQRVGQRPVHGQPPAEHGALVHRGAHQWMTEPDRRVDDVDQPGLLGRPQVGGRRPQRPGRLQHHTQVTAVLRRGHQQQRLGPFGKPTNLSVEGLLQPIGQRQDPIARPGNRRRMEVGRGQLDQAQRVAPRLRLDPGPGHSGQLGATMLGQQRRRRGPVQPAQPQLGQARGGERRVVVACGEDDHDPLCTRRRAANTSASAEARSSQCASSIRHTSGPSSASSPSSDNTASPTRKRSQDPASRSPNAASNAWRCGCESAERRSGTDPSSRCNPANGSAASDCTPAPRSTRTAARPGGTGSPAAAPPDLASPHAAAPAAAAASSSSAVLPMPASPRMTSAPLRPARAPASSRSMTDRSLALPYSTANTYPLSTEA